MAAAGFELAVSLDDRVLATVGSVTAEELAVADVGVGLEFVALSDLSVGPFLSLAALLPFAPRAGQLMSELTADEGQPTDRIQIERIWLNNSLSRVAYTLYIPFSTHSCFLRSVPVEHRLSAGHQRHYQDTKMIAGLGGLVGLAGGVGWTWSTNRERCVVRDAGLAVIVAETGGQGCQPDDGGGADLVLLEGDSVVLVDGLTAGNWKPQ